MQTTRTMLRLTIRVLALSLVSFASLQLALRVADAVFLMRQGQGSAEALPAMLAWLAVVGAGLGLYARAGGGRRPVAECRQS